VWSLLWCSIKPMLHSSTTHRPSSLPLCMYTCITSLHGYQSIPLRQMWQKFHSAEQTASNSNSQMLAMGPLMQEDGQGQACGGRWGLLVAEGVGMSHGSGLCLGGDAEGGEHHVAAQHLEGAVLHCDGVDAHRRRCDLQAKHAYGTPQRNTGARVQSAQKSTCTVWLLQCAHRKL